MITLSIFEQSRARNGKWRCHQAESLGNGQNRSLTVAARSDRAGQSGAPASGFARFYNFLPSIKAVLNYLASNWQSNGTAYINTLNTNVLREFGARRLSQKSCL
jgi:hypothetical protein